MPDMRELKAAAERWRDEDSYIEGPQAEHFRFRDQKTLTDWAVSLLSDAPVTAEWLRDTWGMTNSLDSSNEVPCVWIRGDGPLVRVRFFPDYAPALIVGGDSVEWSHSRGQFTMLAYGLGLKPKEVSNA